MTGSTTRWRTSSHSGGTQSNCIEVEGSLRRVRDSKNRTGPVLRVDLAAFVAAAKDGRLAG
ncbi:MAG TPA: DUF397 domain-containing protein [Pseudonocardiaceae bacterium]|jgi:hypothetical protein|nr:DUF397 domain-containing protein [Pseudonocardiaceae bacterium]